MQLSKKQKKIDQILFAFLRSIINFEHLTKKDDSHSWSISGNTACEKYG